MNRQKKACVKEGNTKPLSQPTRKTFYCFTVFGLNNETENELNRQLGSLCVKYLYGKEICPTTGRTHFQGFMHLKKAMRITELKLIGNPHLEACKGNEEQNIRYCSKEGNVVKFGYPKPLPSTNAVQMHLQWIKNHPNFVPADGNVVDNTKTGGGRVIPHYESMSLLYQNAEAHKIAYLMFREDIRTHANIKKCLSEFEHNTLH